MIVGIDEVGRGSLAGPLCVVAVAWPDEAVVPGLADSKQLSAARRRALTGQIRQHAAAIGVGWVSADQIDIIGLSKALRVAAMQAFRSIDVKYTTVVVDGRDKLLNEVPAKYIIKADASVPAVSAASIIAKVARDTYMQAMHPRYPQYGFAAHVGYGTLAHRQALKLHGPCDLHRLSFAPLRMLA